MAYEDFKKGWKAFIQGAHEPTDGTDFAFGYNAAKYAASRPLPDAHQHEAYAKKEHSHPAAAHEHQVKGTTV